MSLLTRSWDTDIPNRLNSPKGPKTIRNGIINNKNNNHNFNPLSETNTNEITLPSRLSNSNTSPPDFVPPVGSGTIRSHLNKFELLARSNQPNFTPYSFSYAHQKSHSHSHHAHTPRKPVGNFQYSQYAFATNYAFFLFSAVIILSFEDFDKKVYLSIEFALRPPYRIQRKLV